MKKIVLTAVSLLCLLATLSPPASGEESPETLDLRGPYLGQELPGTEALVFAPGVVSLSGRYEYAVSIDPDGDRILFSTESEGQGAAVYCSWIQNGLWTRPQEVSLSGGARSNEMEAFFSPDGKLLYFAPFDEGMDVRIWVADATPDGWRNPRPLGPPADEDPAFYPVPAGDDSLYYTNLAKRATFKARVEGHKVLETGLAGLEMGGHAYPSPDGTFILVDSASLNSEGQRDIFVAFRQKDGTWSSPVSLGANVNTEHSETCPSLSPDGKLLFFSRYNEPGRISNIYWVNSSIVDQVRLRTPSSPPMTE